VVIVYQPGFHVKGARFDRGNEKLKCPCFRQGEMSPVVMREIVFHKLFFSTQREKIIKYTAGETLL